MMNSPYTPPKSDLSGGPVEVDALRWRGAMIFALIPALMMAVFQIQRLYEHWMYVTSSTWEPIMYLLPAVVLAAISGYAVAARCARASLPGIVVLGLVVGCALALVVVITVSVVLQLKGGSSLKLAGQLNALVRIAMVLGPTMVVLCALTRYFGRKLGFR